MSNQIDELMTLANDLLFAPNHLRKKKGQALRTALEGALKPCEPIYAYRNRICAEFLTCDKGSYLQFQKLPNSYEVAIFYRDAPPAQTPYLRVIDEELVIAHLGVANTLDTYEEAKAKVNELIAWHIQVATDPAVNGGFELKPAQVPDAMVKRASELLELFNDPILPEHSGCVSKTPPAQET